MFVSFRNESIRVVLGLPAGGAVVGLTGPAVSAADSAWFEAKSCKREGSWTGSTNTQRVKAQGECALLTNCGNSGQAKIAENGANEWIQRLKSI